MEVVFIRHGQSEANADGIIQGRVDYGLSGQGRDQALRTAAALRDYNPYRVYTSPLSRAAETAKIINRRHNAEIVILDDLIEYDLGEFEGLTVAQVFERFPRVPGRLKSGEPFHTLAPGAESDADVDIRAERALDEILNSGLPRIIVVAHLGLLERIIKKASASFKLELDPGPAAWPLKNCSITHFDFNPLSPRLICFNEVLHL
ncbi:MAG TPA: histidine phosphatase family protein [bacterium]|nr:histidine phosphatase family protein [bacterium]